MSIGSRKKALKIILAAHPKLTPAKGKFREQFASVGGQAREQLVLDYVQAGLVPKPKLVPVTIKDPSNPNISVTYEVMPQYFSIEGIPVQVTPTTAERVAKYFGLSLPTKEITKQIYSQAKHIIPGKPAMDKLGPGSSKLLSYTDEIMSARKGKNISDTDIVVGEYKELELPSQDAGKLHASGLVLPGRPIDPKSFKGVAQDFTGSTAHNTSYVDYTHAFRPVGNFTFTDPSGNKVTMTFDQLMSKSNSDPAYKQIVNLLTGGKNYATSYGQGKIDKATTKPSEGKMPLKQQTSSEPIASKKPSSTTSKHSLSNKEEEAIQEINKFLSQFASEVLERKINIIKRADSIKN